MTTATTPTNSRQKQVLTALRAKTLVKVIAGINNFDLESISNVIQAATLTGATAVDVAARVDIVREARDLTPLAVFASSVSPQELALAAENGADVVEIGNFDALYADGFYVTAQDVLDWTRLTKALIPTETLLSVTIPGHLSLDAQINLAKAVEALGADMLQTEGACKIVSTERGVQVLENPADKFALTLENTLALTQAVSIPVMAASGISHNTLAQAFEAGASGVGIGRAVNQLSNEIEMVKELQLCALALRSIKPLVKAS